MHSSNFFRVFLSIGTLGVTLVVAPISAGPAPIPAVLRLTLVIAQKMLTVSQLAAAKMRVAITCAVVDPRGDLIAMMRMDGVQGYTAEIARAKAITSALFHKPSGSFPPDIASKLQSLSALIRSDILPLQGALPVMVGNAPLGAIGCSGATGQEEEDAAKAAILAIIDGDTRN